MLSARLSVVVAVVAAFIVVVVAVVVAAAVVYINCLPIWSKIGISNFTNENLCAHLYNLHSHTRRHTHTLT